jgi:hypothetical protein
MRKDRLYLFTFFAITAIVFLISIIAVQFFVKASNNQVFELQIENSQREAKEISQLIESQLSSDTPKQVIIENLQLAIQSTHTETSFISMIDWSGKQITHPDKTKVGTKLHSDETSVFSMNDDVTPENLSTILGKSDEETASEIIFLVPIPNSDWIIAAHANIGKTTRQVNSLKQRFYFIFGVMGVIVILSSFFAVRILGSTYEKSLEITNKNLEQELVSTSKFTSDLVAYQQRVITRGEDVFNENYTADSSKKRILTYHRDELLTIPIETIAYIYVDHTITYVVSFDGKKSTTNSSLDELYTNLDNINFYRANRQVIIAVPAIEKIIKYGNSQLKILVQPNADIEIIISKNKAAEFKQWLNL